MVGMAARRRPRRMRRGIGWLLAAAAAIAGSAAAEAEDRGGASLGAPPTLDEAVAAGWLVVEARYPTSALQIQLSLANASDEPRVVDVTGRHLVPPRGRRVQRLALSHPVGDVAPLPGHGRGVFAVAVAAGETRRLLMRCCCMDEGLDAPEPADRYVLAAERTPETTEAAMRWWVEHPDAPREFVNHAVWRSNPALLDRVWEAGEGPHPPPTGDVVRSLGRSLFLLDAGHLTRVELSGARRSLSRRARQVFPESHAVHAVLDAPDAPVLCRMTSDGTPSVPLFPVGEEPLLDLWSVPRGPFLWRTAAGVFARGEADREPRLLFAAADSVRVSLAPVDAGDGRFVLVDRRRRDGKPDEFAVHDVDARAGTVAHRRSFWGLRDMAAGPGGVFALSLGGNLLRLGADHLHRVSAPEALRIVAVGRGRLVLVLREGGLAILEPGEAGPVHLDGDREATGSGVREPRNLAIDPVTDDVVWIADRTVWRLEDRWAGPRALEFAGR